MNKHYSNEYASAEVVINPDLPESLSGVLEVVRVWTDPEHRKEGFATELLKSIIEDADIEGRVLILNPKPFGYSITKGAGAKQEESVHQIRVDKLQTWYERFGFAVIQKKPAVLMARMPQVYKAAFSPVASAAMESTRG